MEKLYRDRDWLYEHYIARKESSLIMAKEAKCGSQTILNWLHRLGIPIHNHNSLWRNRDWLREHYIVQEKSMPIMAKEVGCDLMTIRYWLYKYGIPVRSCGEGQFLARRNSVIITPGLLRFMEGEVVGDGCVSMRPSNRSARYSHGSKYLEYVTWLSECLNKWGIEQSGRITRRKSKQSGFHGAIVYSYQSRSYPELVPIYKRWYPNGKKIVPKDLELTPIMAQQWYIGDGGLTNYKIKHPGIKLSTCDFDKQSVEYLVRELCGLGFKATCRPADNTIGISAYSVQDFLKWIGPCPISCYDYKWAI